MFIINIDQDSRYFFLPFLSVAPKVTRGTPSVPPLYSHPSSPSTRRGHSPSLTPQDDFTNLKQGSCHLLRLLNIRPLTTLG